MTGTGDNNSEAGKADQKLMQMTFETEQQEAILQMKWRRCVSFCAGGADVLHMALRLKLYQLAVWMNLVNWLHSF